VSGYLPNLWDWEYYASSEPSPSFVYSAGIYMQKARHHDLVKFTGCKSSINALSQYHKYLSVRGPSLEGDVAPAPCCNVP
jgi:hypothetical protein